MNKTVKNCARLLNTTLNQVVFCRPCAGEKYGLELELEGRNVALEDVPTKGWKREKDGSLRGESIEYVFSGAADYDESVRRVKNLFELFKKHKVQIENSYRTSTHIHINFADRKLREVVNFFCLYTILEEILEAYCGEGREGNLFCLPSRDVEPIVQMLEDAISKYMNFGHFNEDVRYCAVNLCALSKFGTVEVRTMRGADSEEMVIDWLNIIRQMNTFVRDKMETPARLIESLSFLGAEGFVRQVFNEETTRKLFMRFPERDVHRSLYEGARLIQVFAYRMDEAFCLPFDVAVEEPPQDDLVEFTSGGRKVMLPSAAPHGYVYTTPEGKSYTAVVRDVLMWYNGGVCYGRVFAEQPVGLNPGPNQAIRSIDGQRTYYVPRNPRDGAHVPGVDYIVYDAGEGMWFDTEADEFCEWVN